MVAFVQYRSAGCDPGANRHNDFDALKLIIFRHVENLADFRGKLFDGERFADEFHSMIEHAIMDDGVAGVARRK